MEQSEFNPVDVFEATEEVTVDGETSVVHHSRNPEYSAQDLVDALVDFEEEYEFDSLNDRTVDLLEEVPDIATRVCKFTDSSFFVEFTNDESVPIDLALAGGNTFKLFPFDPSEWEASRYQTSNPSTADVFAATATLVNAVWCIQELRRTIDDSEGVDGSIYTEEYFNSSVTQGMLLAFRDAFLVNAPKKPLQGVWFRERERAVQNAVQNALGFEMDDTELHGLLLADWNKSVCLQDASDYGREKSVNEGMNALKSISDHVSENRD